MASSDIDLPAGEIPPPLKPLERPRSNRMRLLLGFMVLGGIYGAGVCLVRYPPTGKQYQSTAMMLLIPPGNSPAVNRIGIIEEPGPLFQTDMHAQLIRSPVVVQRAVEKFRLNELKSFQSIQPQNVASIIIQNLHTGRAGGPGAPDLQLIEVRYRSANYVDAMTVNKAIIRSYTDFLGESYASANDDFVRLMTLARDELDAELKAKNAALRRFAKEAPAGALDEPTESGPPALTKVRTLRMELSAKRAAKRSVLTTVESAQADGKSPAAIELLLETTNTPGPKEDGDADDGAPSPEASRAAPEKQMATRIEKLRLEVAALDAEDQELAQQQDNAEREEQYLQDFRTQYRVSSGEIKRTEELYQSILDRLTQVNLLKDAGGMTTKLIAPTGEAAAVTDYSLLIAAAGGLVGAAAAYVIVLSLFALYKLAICVLK